MMRVFISWSGDRSGKVATALQQWIPRVIQAVNPWLSSGSIDPGARWSEEVASALEDMDCGVLCLTAENTSAPWILFEAGALSKAVSKSRIIPYLVGLTPPQLSGPLAQFQAVTADKPGTLQLVSGINSSSAGPLLDPGLLAEAFELWWPKLEAVLSHVASLPSREPTPPPRPLEDMMGEVLELLRSDRFRVDGDEAAARTALSGSIGKRIRQLRLAKNIPQRWLAERAGFTQSHISSIENGRSNASALTLSCIAQALGVTVEEVCGPEIVGASGPITEQ